MANQLSQIQHVVHLILENRSFDHMLGYLYGGAAGGKIDGVHGDEANWSPMTNGWEKIFKISEQCPPDQWFYMPGTDPGEGLLHYMDQLFGPGYPYRTGPLLPGGYVADFAGEVFSRRAKGTPKFLPFTNARNVMGVYTPELLPVLSGLAQGYAVCDEWFSSGPIHTWPNRAFAAAATSQGEVDNITVPGWLTTKTIFDALTLDMKQSWSVFGPYGPHSHTRLNFQALLDAPDDLFQTMEDFDSAAMRGLLPSYSLIEPDFGPTGDSQHPNYNVVAGEKLIWHVYNKLRAGANWSSTLLIITYDEHGGLFDHRLPPSDAVPPGDFMHGARGFEFKQFGVRVPAVLVSPWIQQGSVFRAPVGQTIDHTSVLKTLFDRWGGPEPLYLTERDRAAPSLANALNSPTLRTDDPMSGVPEPVVPFPPAEFDATVPSTLELIHARQVAQLPVLRDDGTVEDEAPEIPQTAAELQGFVRDRFARFQRFKLTRASSKSS